MLIDKYYSLQAQVDHNGTTTNVAFDAVLSKQLDLAQRQAQSSVSQLTDRQIDPILQLGAYEVAGIEREKGIDEKLSALGEYWGAFIASRALAYIGGFANV